MRITYAAWLAILAMSPGLRSQTSRTYTLDADFDRGTLLNLDHSTPNQLQVRSGGSAFPYISFPWYGGSVIRLDTNTGAVVGRYHSAPDGMALYAKATAADRLGNVWVQNSKEYGLVNGVPKGSVVRVGLTIGGTRSDALGNPDPNGQYLKPPFRYTTCVDRNHDGLVKTSRGLLDILPWPNTADADTAGGVSTAEDECIINYTRTYTLGSDSLIGTLVVDANNDLWVGGYHSDAFHGHEKLSGVTGQPVPGTQFNPGVAGYGGFLDRLGNIWSRAPAIRLTPSLANPPGIITTFSAGYPDWWNAWAYAPDPVTGNIIALWQTSILEVDLNGNLVGQSPTPYFWGGGLTVDLNGEVWLVGGPNVHHYRRNPANPSVFQFVGMFQAGMYGWEDMRNIVVDGNNKMWTFSMYPRSAVRIDPAINGGVGGIDLMVPLMDGEFASGTGDLTGAQAQGAVGFTGIWRAVQDAGQTGAAWGKLWWTAGVPAGAAVSLMVRAADSEAALSGRPFVPAGNGGSLCGAGLAGRYLEIEAVLRRAPAGPSPVLYDLTVQGCNIDTTPPVIEPVLSGAIGNNGWYTGPVSLHWNITDPESGIASSQGCQDQTFAADTTWTCSAVNGAGLQASRQVTVRIDRTPPAVTCTATPATIWPANHKMVPVTIAVNLADAGSGANGFLLVAAGSTPSAAADDIAGFTIGSATVTGALRAEKDRVYTLTYRGTDKAGNAATCAATVSVPHDQGQ